MHQAIKEGYLSPVRAQMIPLELDIHGAGISNGDYAVGQIGSALDPINKLTRRESCFYFS